MKQKNNEEKPREKLVDLINSQLPENNKLNSKEDKRFRLTNKDIETIYKTVCDIKDKEPKFKVENQNVKPINEGVTN